MNLIRQSHKALPGQIIVARIYDDIDELNNCQMVFRSARWRCSQLFSGVPCSKKSDANVEDSDCTVLMLLIFSIRSTCAIMAETASK